MKMLHEVAVNGNLTWRFLVDIYDILLQLRKMRVQCYQNLHRDR